MPRGIFIPLTEEIGISCPYCGEAIEVEVECSDGSPQQFEEDCVVCCQPIYINVRLEYDGSVSSEVRREDEE